MKNQIHSEWLKLRTVRAPGVAALVLFGFVLMIAGLASGTIPADGGSDADIGMVLGAAGGTLPGMLMVVLGLLSVGNEFHNKSIINTYLATPRRNRVLAAKLTVMGGLGALLGTVCALATLGLALPILQARATETGLTGPGAMALHVGACAAVAGLGGALGVGLGACFRSPVIGIVAFLVWTSAGEGIAGLVVPQDVLPTGAMRTAVTGGDFAPAWVGLVAMAGYVAVAAALAGRRYGPRDVRA